MKKHRKTPRKEPSVPNPLSRPVHKANIINAKKTTAVDYAHPEPMSLMRKREKELDRQFSYIDRNGKRHEAPHRKPEVTNGSADKAATAAAEWDLNDPFTYSRTFLHTKQGYINSDDAVKEFAMRTLARRAARIREVDSAKLASVSE